MFGLGAGELLIIFIFALLFIGPKKLPDLAKSLGKGLREFQKARQGIFDQMEKGVAVDENDQETPRKQKPPEVLQKNPQDSQ